MFGDYWAFTSGPTGPGDFDPACIAEWDFNPSGCLRRVDGAKHYPEDIVHEVHADGEIWSSALHDIHLTAGRETTDRIVLQSHFLVPMFPRFCDGARALRDADDLLDGGANRAAIGGALASRGIAGDFAVANFLSTSLDPATHAIHFEIVNQGNCGVGPAVHRVEQVCADGLPVAPPVEVATDGLLRGESAIFDLTFAAQPGSCHYRVSADAKNEEIETREDNNIIEGPFVGV